MSSAPTVVRNMPTRFRIETVIGYSLVSQRILAEPAAVPGYMLVRREYPITR
jgi:hypothetical protein